MNSNSVVRTLFIVFALLLLAPVNAVYVFADSDGVSRNIELAKRKKNKAESMKARTKSDDPAKPLLDSKEKKPEKEKSQNDDDLAKPLLDSKKKPLPYSKTKKPALEKRPKKNKYITKVKTKPFPIWTTVGIGVAAAGVIGLAIGSSGGSDSPSITPTSPTSDTPATDTPVTPTPTPTSKSQEIVGPDISGSEWSGSILYRTAGEDRITATITQEGDQVTILTSLPAGSLGHLLIGSMSPSGAMFMYDQSDGEDWTSIYHPANSNSIALADYVFIDGYNTGTNIMKLRR